MGWRLTFAVEDEEVVVDLDELSPDVFDELAREEAIGNWMSVHDFPGETFDRMYRVICAAAQHAGVEPPERAQTYKDAEILQAMFSRGSDIADEPMTDGFPPEPATSSEASSSGSPEDSTGPQTSFAGSQSETS